MKRVFLVLLVVPMMACESEELQNYANARECVNNATAASVQTCVAALGNDQSPRANKLRCAAGFIEQGMDNTRLAQIFSQAQGEDSSNLELFSRSLVFGSSSGPGDAVSKAQQTKTYCKNSQSVGMTMFGSMAYSATLMASTFGGWDGTYADFESDGSDFTNIVDASNDTELGNNVIDIQNAYCSLESAQDDVCNQINTIINNAGGTSDPDAVGAAFRAYL